MKLGNIDFHAGMSGLAVKLLLVAVLVPAMLVTAACKQKDNSAQNTAQSTPAGDTSETQGGNPVVIISTSKGDIKVELFKNEAPVTVENFLSYVNDGFYDGTIFHRVIPNFMVQGGGFTPDFAQKPTKAPIKNEANNGLKNDRGTLAMARTQVVDSATSQFFINIVNNDFFNNGARDFGYAVFGKVIDGMDVVDAIAAVPTSNKGMHGDVPTEDVVIESVKVVE
jgi:peptidyl-prolyl cis-trans isomerase A (cyclophilin A)